MPPKRKFDREGGMPLDVLPGFGTKGWLSDTAKGVIYGLAYSGMKYSDVATIAQTTVATVSRTVAAVEEALAAADRARPQPGDRRAESVEAPETIHSDDTSNDTDDAETSAAGAKKKTPAERKEFKNRLEQQVYTQLYKKNSHGEYVHKNSRDIRQAIAKLKRGQAWSVRTIQRYVSELGGEWIKRPITAPLNDDRMKNRVEIATKLLKMIQDDPTLPTRIVFTDESILRAEDMQAHALRRQGEDVQPRRKAKWVSQVMVWGAIGVGLKQLVFLDGIVDADFYTEYLDDFLFAPDETDFMSTNRVLMHDGARPHTAKTTTAALAAKQISVLQWAAYSPDWNPIENLWSNLKRRMTTSCFDDKPELEDCALEAWNSITQAEIDTLCLSFVSRLEETVRRNGEDCQI